MPSSNLKNQIQGTEYPFNLNIEIFKAVFYCLDRKYLIGVLNLEESIKNNFES